jgi:hypothetical protein
MKKEIKKRKKTDNKIPIGVWPARGLRGNKCLGSPHTKKAKKKSEARSKKKEKGTGKAKKKEES